MTDQATAAPAPNGQDVKQPSAARCNRVHQALLKEPAFKDIIGTTMVSVPRRDGVVENYPESVVEITTRMQSRDLDANTATRDEILDEAKTYFANCKVGPAAPPSVTLTADSDVALLADHAALAVYSLLLSAKAIGENDRKPGAASRLQALKKALDIYRPCITSFTPVK